MRRAGAALVVGVLLAAGCSADHDEWREVKLPGVGAMTRDAARCGARTFVVGALRDDSGGTKPAVWSSTDGVSWSSAAMEPITFYGEQNVLSAVACRADGRLVAVGAKSGGVHGNPRTSSWLSPDGARFTEVAGDFQLFGGPDAVSVGRVAAGPAGFLIVGNRVQGAAVWSSADGAAFELRAGVPGLASDAAGTTWADDVVAVDGGWVVVGAVRGPAGGGVGWRSADGVSWSRLAVEDGSRELQRVVVVSGVPLAVGLDGSGFGSWRLDGARWRRVGEFGAAGVEVRSVAVAGDRVFAVTSDGKAFGVWRSADAGSHWESVPMPVRVPVGGDGSLVVTAMNGRAVLVVDGGTGARLFEAV